MENSKASTVRFLYLLLAGYVVSSGFLNVLSHSIFGSLTMRKIAAPAMYSWAILIPLSLIVIWTLNRKVRKAHSKRQRWTMRLSWLPLWGLWLYSSAAGLLYIAVYEPWPFNFHHGPDTEYSREGFVRHAGMPVPPSVTQVYFTSLGVMERYDTLMFQTSDADVVTQIVEHQELVEADSTEPGQHAMVGSSCSASKMARNPMLQCYFRDQGRQHWSLSYDPVTESVSYVYVTP